ncbi:nitroreductase family deazaflavin-dependent oxidoreductase [Nocardiopsis gilva YIM 90087]|uniref:Nitroreductase family deazaflavin-dependent oxidoreductase n=1 Tax=Nocardiopsis gilva YIM 90087 TaxID=1235441 RepID=A0A223SCQ6_9ACTN|nr:nitroreductase/quinone reductase family protein [Nocardiopsis gilva]ASU85866.1 nitroreductase family deazaflavin-dependent oxidoreductase [Nocardiopsis gilva YIM 90087]
MSTDVNQPVIEEFRTNGGKVGGPFEGGDLLLLTTTGAKSGSEHTVPLGFIRDGDQLLVVASAAGAPQHPVWYHNLLANPLVQVEIGTEQFEAIAVPAEGERRDRLFAHVVREQPGYGDYQARTDRILPVVVLERGDPQDGEAPAEVTNLADKMLEVHTWLRSQLRHVRAEVDAHFAALAAHQGPGRPPAPGLGLQIRQHCLAFCQFLEFHHKGEDEHLFPNVRNYHPHLGSTLDRLHEEHQTVARLQGELVTLLADISSADPERLRFELDRLAEELRAHLDYEEESIFPVLRDVPWPPPQVAEA